MGKVPSGGPRHTHRAQLKFIVDMRRKCFLKLHCTGTEPSAVTVPDAAAASGYFIIWCHQQRLVFSPQGVRFAPAPRWPLNGDKDFFRRTGPQGGREKLNGANWPMMSVCAINRLMTSLPAINGPMMSVCAVNKLMIYAINRLMMSLCTSNRLMLAVVYYYRAADDDTIIRLMLGACY